MDAAVEATACIGSETACEELEIEQCLNQCALVAVGRPVEQRVLTIGTLADPEVHVNCASVDEGRDSGLVASG